MTWRDGITPAAQLAIGTGKPTTMYPGIPGWALQALAEVVGGTEAVPAHPDQRRWMRALGRDVAALPHQARSERRAAVRDGAEVRRTAVILPDTPRAHQGLRMVRELFGGEKG